MSRYLSRRQALLALSLSLSGAALMLAGCGGGGNGGGQDVETRGAKGRVALPAGSALAVADLKLANAFGTVSTSPDGAFALNVLTESPTLALALDGSGQLALFGFIDPGADEAQNVIDASSAAVALLFFALGGAQVPVEFKATMLGLIRAEPAVAPLAQALTARLAADPHALGLGDTTIQEAVKSAVDAVRAGQGGSAGRKFAGQSSRVPTRQEGLPPQLLVQPTSWQSGTEVLIDPARDGAIVPINHHRRECKLFAYRVGFENEQGVRQDLDKAEALNLGDSLPATSAVGGVWTTIAEMITGSTALSPVTGKPVPITMRAGETKTFAEVVVVGSAFTQNEPPFFAEPRYADQVGLWREVRGRLNLISWLRDLVFGLLLEVLGVRGAVADVALYEAAALAWEEIDDLALRAIIGAAKRGELPAALSNLVRLALEPGATVTFRQLQAKSATLLATIAGEKLAMSEGLWLTGFKAFSSLLLGIPGIILGAIDLGAVIADMSAANAGDLWTATVVKPTVRISPPTAQLSRGQELNLTATTPGAGGATFVYAWTLTGSNLASLRGDNKVGAAIETNADTVALATTPSTNGTLTVTVKVYRVAEGGQRSLVGEAKASITMTSASNLRTIVTEDFDTGEFPTGSGNFRIAAGFLSFPLSSQPVNHYLITTVRRGIVNTYRVNASDVGDPIPDSQNLDANARQIPWGRIEGVNNGVFFYRRRDNLYLRYTSEGYYGDPAGPIARMIAFGEIYEEVRFEIVP